MKLFSPLNLRGVLAALMTTCFLGSSVAVAQTQDVVRIGCKNFTEQEILGEIIAQLIERISDLNVERRFGLGGTDICHSALLSGDLDIYVEYTGTGLLNVLKRDVISNPYHAYRVVATGYREKYDLIWLPPIGFNNTYTIAVRERDALENGWTSVSDLTKAASERTAGFTSEFMERPDGYPGLRDAYGIEFGSAIDLDPGLMYEAVANGQVDVICAFATDGRIAEFDLRTLEDDRDFFPPYDAAPIVRGELLEARPQIREILAVLAGTIDDAAMRDMNHAVDVLKQRTADVANRWIVEHLGSEDELAELGDRFDDEEVASFWYLLFVERRGDVIRKTLEHLVLTALGTGIAIFIGVPLGILIHRVAPVRGPVLALTEIVQTIPSLAMLAFLFAVYGLLGTAPAVTALVLYALLPIVLNTFTGLREVPNQILQAADGVGMSTFQKLRMVELPLAAPVIVAGIRAATVLTVGIATLSTYIGAGGLGDFIARGLARTDTRLTMLGALPAAAMAVILSLIIRAIEKSLVRK